MRIEARVTYGALCKQLGVDSIPGLPAMEGSAEPSQVVIRLKDVTVDDDDARSVLIERDKWDDESVLADDADALRDFIDALLAGDLPLARLLGDRVFEDEGMRLACERTLAAPQRNAA